jgi:hypothetical protein
LFLNGKLEGKHFAEINNMNKMGKNCAKKPTIGFGVQHRTLSFIAHLLLFVRKRQMTTVPNLPKFIALQKAKFSRNN